MDSNNNDTVNKYDALKYDKINYWNDDMMFDNINNHCKILICAHNSINKKQLFIFACTLSGIGKIKLAFSLNIPFLYFNLRNRKRW